VIGNDAFQEVDAVGITRSCVKHNFLVKDTNDLATIVKKAFHIATTGRPGPVLIDITKDTTITEIEFDGYPKSINMRSYQPEIKVDAGQIDRAVALITQAKKPIIYSGGGSVIVAKSLVSFTKKLCLTQERVIPTASTSWNASLPITAEDT
jgi:acetolactate synthase-1/2/3 large subunit